MKATKKIVLDEDLSKVGTALGRAARQARKIAERTHTPLVIYEHGRLIRTRPSATQSGNPSSRSRKRSARKANQESLSR
jgi:hypothetical protein